jgi:hypothetical protein
MQSGGLLLQVFFLRKKHKITRGDGRIFWGVQWGAPLPPPRKNFPTPPREICIPEKCFNIHWDE